MKKTQVKFQLDDKEIEIETGKLAKQAGGSAFVTCGENKVLVTVVSAKKESTADFFPLTVEYSEKLFSIGKIPGGYFKREGRPTNEAILNCRLIDRPIRPCFPEAYRYETQIIAQVLSYNGEFPAHSLASLGASAALHISDIPFSGPIAALQLARIADDKGKKTLIANPSFSQLNQSDMNLFIAGHAGGLLMVEGEAHSIPEEEFLEALKFGHKAMIPALEAQKTLRQQSGSKTKRSYNLPDQPERQFKERVQNFLKSKIEKSFQIKGKKERSEALQQIRAEMEENFLQDISFSETRNKELHSESNFSPPNKTEATSHHPLSAKEAYQAFQEIETSQKLKAKQLQSIFEEEKYHFLRKKILDTHSRVDGRGLENIRPIECEVSLLPRTHGSALFTRGETQVLATITLGTPEDEQMVDSLDGVLKKRFILHYNFPPYCVGEVGRLGGQSRREVGHGSLAESALKSLLPSQEKFPYVIRVVSEVLESNGSSSMGTVCAGALALLDAGVPLRENVAGIAMGLVKEGDRVAILSDILGDEDHLGDMDFKVAGSLRGLTAVQMDIKVDGIDFDIIEKALKQARKGRLFILEEMEKVIKRPRDQISKHAPKIVQIRVKPEKVKDIIGAGGKVVKGIIEETGVKINIEDDGLIHISSSHPPSANRAIKMIQDICAEAEVGKTYKGKVTKITDFGAFIEVLPNTSGLLHISEIAHKRIQYVSDVIKEGEEVEVKVMDIDRSGRIKLSRKALLRRP